jgi:hypothetical protein
MVNLFTFLIKEVNMLPNSKIVKKEVMVYFILMVVINSRVNPKMRKFWQKDLLFEQRR